MELKMLSLFENAQNLTISIMVIYDGAVLCRDD